jgi:hypothetical protein
MCTNLKTEGLHHLLKLLQKYEHLFDGTVGVFNMDPIGLHLIDKGANQYMLAHILFLDL